MQKGIGAIHILVILVLLVLAGSMGYVYLQPKKEISKPPEYKSTAKTAPPESAPVPTPPDETANWKTYRNEKYGFEFRYPQDFPIGESSVANRPPHVITLLGPRGAGDSVLFVHVTPSAGKDLAILTDEIKTQNPEAIITKIAGINTEGIRVEQADPYEGSFIHASLVYYFYKSSYFYIFITWSGVDSKVVSILSTFKFIKNSVEIKQPPAESTATPPPSLPTTCIDEQEGVPVITSLSSYFGLVGTRIEIRGCNFSGFEGDKNALIENSQGVVGFFRGEAGSTSKLLKVILKSPLCHSLKRHRFAVFCLFNAK